jgi:hypothetical protein
LRYRLLINSIFLIVAIDVVSGQDSISRTPLVQVRGYVKGLQGIYFYDDLSTLTSSDLIHNRFNFKFNISPVFTGRIEVRNRIFWGDQLKQIPGFGKSIDQYNGLLKLSHLWVDEKTLVVHSVIDRMVLQYATDQWDVRIGRQRINWGVNTIWNPNDIFNAYNFLDFDYEERPGNDAIRVQRYFRNSTSAEVAIKPGEHKDETIAALLYHFNTSKYDVQVLAGVFNSDYVVGGGWAGNIKEAGFKGEISYFHPKDKSGDTSGVVSLSLMADQTFKGEWYLSASFLYNSKPSGLPIGGGGIFTNELSAKNLYPYKYTLYAGAMKSLTPITSLSMAIIYSPKYNSLLLFPSFSWNVANNFDISLIAQSFFARYLDSSRTQGNAIFLRSKWSF